MQSRVVPLYRCKATLLRFMAAAYTQLYLWQAAIHLVCQCRMSSLHQLQAGQPKTDTVQAEILLAEQDLVAAKQAGDGAEVVFLRKKLEQLREEKLIILRSQTQGQTRIHLAHGLLSYWTSRDDAQNDASHSPVLVLCMQSQMSPTIHVGKIMLQCAHYCLIAVVLAVVRDE